MESKNKFISVVYQLYTVEGEERVLQEQTGSERPFEFLSGFGVALDAFEREILSRQQGDLFDFTLQPSEAFGEHHPEGVHVLNREIFCDNGKFDRDHVYPGAVITLTASQDQQIMATVTKVEGDSVTIDTNHPFAGKTLNFTGVIRTLRDATEEEVQHFIRQLTGGCGGCGKGGCGEGGCGGNGCGNGEDCGEGCCNCNS